MYTATVKSSLNCTFSKRQIQKTVLTSALVNVHRFGTNKFAYHTQLACCMYVVADIERPEVSNYYLKFFNIPSPVTAIELVCVAGGDEAKFAWLRC